MDKQKGIEILEEEMATLKWDIWEMFPVQKRTDAMKAEFEEKMKDPAFAKDSQAILNFFYEKVKKTAHQNNELHPAWRVMDSTQIFK